MNEAVQETTEELREAAWERIGNGFIMAAVDAYEEAADWTDTDQLTTRAEEAGIDVLGWHKSLEDSFATDVRGFVCEVAHLVEEMDPGQVGHDFWLTRNRHGAGFWDRGLGAVGDELTEAAHAYGEVSLYVGDDGWIYD